MTPRLVACLAALFLVTGVAGCSGTQPHPAARADARTPVHVDIGDCASHWRPTVAGSFRLSFTNVAHQDGEVRIVDPATQAVYADIEPLPQGATADLDVALGPGHYAVECLFEAESGVQGPRLTLTGRAPADAAPGVTPVTLSDLAGPVRSYQRWVRGQLPALTAQVAAMTDALVRGDRAAAQQAWRTGHADYERLGAAYDAFGDLDGAINGLPAGLPRGVDDPHWTGFHAIERGLWGSATPASLVPLARALLTDVGKLRTVMRPAPSSNPAEPEINVAPGVIDPLTLSIRAHEIAENTLQVSLTGRDDFGAHSSIETAAANLDGTAAVLDLLAPLLQGRVDTAPIQVDIAQARAAVTACSTGDVRRLPTAERERVDAAFAQLTEDLAPVASVLEPRRAR